MVFISRHNIYFNGFFLGVEVKGTYAHTFLKANFHRWNITLFFTKQIKTRITPFIIEN